MRVQITVHFADGVREIIRDLPDNLTNGQYVVAVEDIAAAEAKVMGKKIEDVEYEVLS